MALRSVIMWALLLAMVVLVQSTDVQAQELREVPVNVILEQIENGEDIYLNNVRIIGELNLNTIELETHPITRTALQMRFAGLDDELKIVESEITIINSIFENDVDFSNTLFRKRLDFYGTAFSDNTGFRGTSFGGGYTSFIGASFGGAAYFGDASFNGDASFMGASFNDGVNFHSCDYKSLEVSWSSLKDALVFDGPTYVKLIKNFRELEQFDDADAAYFQYRRLSQANKEWSFSKLGDLFMWVSCGYGVKPHYTIGLAVVLILVFALIYWLGNGIRRLKESGEASSRVSFGDAFYFSMVTFTTVGYGDWYPTDKYRKFVVIEGLLGWLTLTLFLVTLANVMIRP